MAQLQLTTKRIQIDKAQATMVGVIAATVFVTIFSLLASKALWAQRGYQARVIGKKQEARKQLDTNIESVRDLVVSYRQFVNSKTNILGGNPAGAGDLDGDNARLVLDALPSKYDFPALASSLEKIFEDRKFNGTTSGTDDEVAQSAKEVSGAPEPVEIPLQISMSGSYASVQDLVSVFEKSIRPFNVQTVSLSGAADSMQISLSLKTYYQPEKTLNITQEVVK